MQKVEQGEDNPSSYDTRRRSKREFSKTRRAAATFGQTEALESTPEAFPTIPLHVQEVLSPPHLMQPSTSQQSAQCQMMLMHSQRGEKRTNEVTPIPCQLTRVSIGHNYKSAGNAETENSINSAMLELKELKRANNFSSIKEDCFDHFGRYVASLLRNLPSQTAFELQQEVINIILQPHVFASMNSGSSPSASRCNGDPSEIME